MGNYVVKRNGYLIPYIGAELEDIEQEPDGYLMSYKEYLAYKTQVSGFETEKYLIHQKCEREISDAYKTLYESKLKNAQKQIRKELSQQQQYYIDKNEELRNTIAELNNEISLLTENCENLKKSKTSLDNLMRIKREQGNAARGIINKKQHHGYIIIMAILSSIVKKLKIVTSGNIIIKKHHGNLSFRPLIWLIVPILALETRSSPN